MDETADPRPRVDLGARRWSAVEQITAAARRHEAATRPTLARRAMEGAATKEIRGLAAIESSLTRMRDAVTTSSSRTFPSVPPVLPRYEGPGYERIDVAEMEAELEAGVAEVAEALAQERRETVAREVRMLDTMEGMLAVLQSQEARARHDARWQLAIYLMSVFAFAGTTVLGVAAVTTAWWSLLAAAVGAALLSAGVWLLVLRRASAG